MRNLTQTYLFSGVALLAAAALPCHAQLTASQQSAIQGVFGVSGTMKPGGVLSFDLARPGATATIAGQPVSPDLAFHGEINFFVAAAQSGGTTGSATGSTTSGTTGSAGSTTAGASSGTVAANAVLVTLETPLLETEVNPYVNALIPAGIAVGAIHNHYLMESPRIIFVHGEGAGDATAIAQAIQTALATTALKVTAPGTATANAGSLDPTALATALGGTPEVGNGVVHVEVNRADPFTLFGIPVPPSIGAASMFDFQASGSAGLTTFEIAVLPSEAPAVQRMLQANGVTFTAVHNHNIALAPPLFFIHGSAMGAPATVAAQLRQVLNQTNSQASPRIAFGPAQ